MVQSNYHAPMVQSNYNAPMVQSNYNGSEIKYINTPQHLVDIRHDANQLYTTNEWDRQQNLKNGSTVNISQLKSNNYG